MRQSDRERVNSLCIKAKEGDRAAEAEIIRLFEGDVRRMSSGVYFKGAGREDVLQTAKIAVFEAVKSFDSGKGVSFDVFCRVCIRNRLADGIKGSLREKHRPLNDYVSFSGATGEEEDGMSRIIPPVRSAEEAFFESEREEIPEEIELKLSGLERAVLLSYLRSLSYDRIAEELNVTKKTVDNAMARIRKKLSK